MANANIKVWGEVTGLGDDKKFTANSNITAPVESVQGYMLVSSVISTDAVPIDVANISPASLRGIAVKAMAGTIYINPVSSANVTTGCVLTAGSWPAVFTFSTSTNLVWVTAVATTDAISYLAFGVAS